MSRKTEFLNRTVDGFYANAVDYQNGDASVDVTKYFDTDDEAQEFIAQFPKSCRLRTGRLDGGASDEPTWTLASVRGQFRLVSNGATGSKNEAAIKRFLTFERKCQQLGLVINYGEFYTNSIDRDALDRFLV